jgi:hypothetical protein
MKDKDFKNIIELSYMGGGFIPANEKAQELADNCTKGEIVEFQEVTARDLAFHRAYFSLLNFIYKYLPGSFQKLISQSKFHTWLKHLQGNYEILYTFKDGTTLVEYQSISFGSMSQKRFEEYIKGQLPFIYENVLGAFYEGEMLSGIIETIEEEYEKFLIKL